MIIAAYMAMDIKLLMNRIEELRVSNKIHKATLCAEAGITTTYYNQILRDGKQPSYTIVSALLRGVGQVFIVADSFLLQGITLDR